MLRIKIIDIGTPHSRQTAKGLEYQTIEVIYKDDQNQVLSKNLVSFAQKTVFKAASSWTKGTEIDIESELDSKGWVQWVDFTIVSSPSLDNIDFGDGDVPL